MLTCTICGITISNLRKRNGVCDSKYCQNQKAREIYKKHLVEITCNICNIKFQGTAKRKTCSAQECRAKANKLKAPQQEIIVQLHCKLCNISVGTEIKKLTNRTNHSSAKKICPTCQADNREKHSIAKKLSNPMRKLSFNSLEEYAEYQEKRISEKEELKLKRREENRERMRLNNPMFNLESREKGKQTYKKNLESGKLIFPKGIKHRNYKGNRPLSFFLRLQLKSWRNTIFERDNWKCVNCSSRKNLHVHHLVPFRDILKSFNVKGLKGPTKLLNQTELQELTDKIIDYHNSNLEIGITLCQICHGKEDEHYKAVNSKKIKNQEHWK